MLVIENGPGGTLERLTSALFTNTSTVEGSAAEAPAVWIGKRTKPGRVEKLVPYCTPPRRVGSPHAPGTLTVSPRRSVSSRAGKSTV